MSSLKYKKNKFRVGDIIKLENLTTEEFEVIGVAFHSYGEHGSPCFTYLIQSNNKEDGGQLGNSLKDWEKYGYIISPKWDPKKYNLWVREEVISCSETTTLINKIRFEIGL